MHAHLLAVGLERELRFPAIGLLVSGGHTHLYRMESPWDCRLLGRTLDDAAGEAFDKVGKFLGLAYPGGKLMDALSRAGQATPTLFPRPYLDNDNLDFSFSGLKTSATGLAARQLAGHQWPRPLTDIGHAPQALKDYCASFNLAVVETLCIKTARALERNTVVKTLVMAGGVACNSLLRQPLGSVRWQRRALLSLASDFAPAAASLQRPQC